MSDESIILLNLKRLKLNIGSGGTMADLTAPINSISVIVVAILIGGGVPAYTYGKCLTKT